MNFIPHNYQQHCICQIIDKPSVALWLDMGLGKTAITLTAINELKYNRFCIRKVLIIAPKKVAEATWQKEAKKWAHLSLLRINTVLGTTAQRIRALNRSADIYIINRDNVAWLVDYYKNAWPFGMLILDEATSFKSAKAKRFKKLKAIRSHVTRIVELTGTPSPRNLLDLWAQMFLLDEGKRLGKTVGSFRDAYFSPDKRNRTQVFSYKPRDGAEQSVKKLLGDICISMKASDYIGLPAMIEDDIPVVLDTTAQRAYNKMEKEMFLCVDDDTLDAGSAAVLRGKLMQIGNGACYDEAKKIVPIHDCKLEALLELLEQLGDEHALICYAFQHDRERIIECVHKSRELSSKMIKVFNGKDDEAAWNAGGIDYLLVHPASCAYGLNIQDGGHHVIWFGFNDSLELYLQANARLHRQGQKQPVIIHRLIVQGSIDEDIIAGLESKEKMQEMLLQSMKARIEKIKEKQ